MTEYCSGVINHFAQASPATAQLLAEGLPMLDAGITFHVADYQDFLIDLG